MNSIPIKSTSPTTNKIQETKYSLCMIRLDETFAPNIIYSDKLWTSQGNIIKNNDI